MSFSFWSLKSSEALTLADKVGLMVMAGVPGLSVGAEAQHLIKTYRIGNIILFGENVESPQQVLALTRDLQQTAHDAGAPAPLLIAIDQEGGPVVRLREGVTPLPSMMTLGALGSAKAAEELGALCGTELAMLGINMNLAPVLDVNNNPSNPVIGIRSFGEDPRRVATLGTAYIKGLQRAGVLAAAKHFPGHGDTDLDSHLALPTISHSMSRLKQVELVPFQAAIQVGVDAVMSAHVTFPAIDPTPGLPSTMSETVLTGLLREQLGFEGLIVTDALEMRGVSDHYPMAEAAVRAVQAGADIVLIAQSQYGGEAVQAVSALTEAVTRGAISMDRIDQSVTRILAAKRTVMHRRMRADRGSSAPAERDVKRRLSNLAGQKAMAFVEGLTRRAVTVVRNDSGILPLALSDLARVVLVGPAPAVEFLANRFLSHSSPEDGAPHPSSARVELDVVGVFSKPSGEEMRSIVATSALADTIVVVTIWAWQRPEQAQLVRELDGLGRPLVVVAGDTPYDLLSFPNVSTYVAAYGASRLHMEATADVLLGAAKTEGRLPVALPGLYSVGHRWEKG